MLNNENIKIKIFDNKVEILSKIDCFLTLNFDLFRSQIEDAKINFSKEGFIIKNEKFLEIEIIKENNFLKSKIINIIFNSDFITLCNIKNFITSIILVRDEIDINDKTPVEFFNFLKEYKINLDEINLTIPEESQILSSIDELIIKSDFILLLYEEKTKEKIKKYLKDLGYILKIDELFVLKRYNKKIIILSIERFNDLINNILKEVYAK
ncbi:MAG: hypothetical protein N3D74_01410 [Caldisericia bacterium]|nr:hypothetical protein [Caldisericia bacterium]